jgi:DNA polymerase-3 subunit chi
VPVAAREPAGVPQVDFYILPGTAGAARLKFACRLIEKAYLEGSRCLVRVGDTAELESLDALLWTFAERAFVPHDRLEGDAATGPAPVLLTAGALPPMPDGFAVLFDLALGAPPADVPPTRIVEVVDADETRRRLGRERFRAYRERGWTPATHNIDNETDTANG